MQALAHLPLAEHYPAVAFIAKVIAQLHAVPPSKQKRIADRVKAAIKDPQNMRALELEFLVATQLFRRGFTPSWPDIDGTGNCDLFLPGIGGVGLQIECKAASRDIGRAIKRADIYAFYRIVLPKLRALCANISKGVFVVLTVPDSLPSAHEQLEMLSDDLVRQILIGVTSDLQGGLQVRIGTFDPEILAGIDPAMPSQDHRALVDQVTCTSNREMLIHGTPAGGALIVITQSAKADNPLKAIFGTLKNSWKNQVNHNQPCAFLVGLEGIDAGALEQLALEDFSNESGPTALRLSVSKFLGSLERENVVNVSFASTDTSWSSENGVITSSGIIYSFPRRESPYWSDEFDNVFIERSIASRPSRVAL